MTTLLIVLFYTGILGLVLLGILLIDNLFQMLYWMWNNKYNKTNTQYETKKIAHYKKSICVTLSMILIIISGMIFYNLPIGFEEIMGNKEPCQVVKKIYVHRYDCNGEDVKKEITNKNEIRDVFNSLIKYKYKRNIHDSRFGYNIRMMSETEFIVLDFVTKVSGKSVAYISLNIANGGNIYDRLSGQAYKVKTDNKRQYFNQLAKTIFSEQDSNVSSMQSNSYHEVTLEQIKGTYKPGEILDIKTYDDNYVLIKSHQVREPDGETASDPNDKYTFYNLKTGDTDELDIAPFIVELQNIESPDHITFFCNGQNIVAPFHDFPFLLSFERKEENADSNSDFNMTRLPQYYSLDKNIIFGDASNAIISDINITDKDMEVTFTDSDGPYDFILADGRIPVTSVDYIHDKNQILFKFKKSLISKKYKSNGNKINQGNDYMDSIELKDNTDNAEIIINLKPSTKQYSCRITEDGTLKIFFK